MMMYSLVRPKDHLLTANVPGLGVQGSGGLTLEETDRTYADDSSNERSWCID